MARTIEVDIDESGAVHPMQPTQKLPPGRALLTWLDTEQAMGLLLSERALAEDGCGRKRMRHGLFAAGQVVLLPFPYSDLSGRNFDPFFCSQAPDAKTG